MQCRLVEERIQGLLDDLLDPSFDSVLIEHASTCASCRDLLEAQGKLFDGLQTSALPPLSADFSQRVVGVVVMQRRRQRITPAVAVLAIIATMLLVVALGPRSGRKVKRPKMASADITQSYQGSLAGLSVDFDSREVGIAVQRFVAQLASGRGSGFYQVDQLTGTIRPLASTLNVAFDAIRRTIPIRHLSNPEPQTTDLRVQRDLFVI
jgi:predicted anti-sigma-YlaC factor YlaD